MKDDITKQFIGKEIVNIGKSVSISVNKEKQNNWQSFLKRISQFSRIMEYKFLS